MLTFKEIIDEPDRDTRRSAMLDWCSVQSATYYATARNADGDFNEFPTIDITICGGVFTSPSDAWAFMDEDELAELNDELAWDIGPEGRNDEPEEIEQPPLRFILESLQPGYTALCCPVCGFDYVHITGVQVVQGSTTTIISRETTTTCGDGFKGKGPRGSEVRLCFQCENGHDFYYQFEFHKGNTFCNLHAQRSEEGDREELWRD